MTLRYNEKDTNVANGIVQLDATGKMPVLNGSQLTGIDNLPTANVTNNFDAYQVKTVSTNTTMTSNTLYFVTASCQLDFPAGAQGDRIAFVIVDDGITVTMSAQGGNLGTARRFCYKGKCYGNGNNIAGSQFGTIVFGTATATGKGVCREFFRISDGIAVAWVEKSHQQFFDTSGGATEQGNWANFDRAYITNPASSIGHRYTLTYDEIGRAHV